MSEKITILVDPELLKAIKGYCKDNRINRSSFIRSLVTDKLIEEKYIIKEENKK